jgi:hypothetical protein
MEITHHELSTGNHPRFAALSYAWGDLEKTRHAFVQSPTHHSTRAQSHTHIPITANLEEALRFLRRIGNAAFSGSTQSASAKEIWQSGRTKSRKYPVYFDSRRQSSLGLGPSQMTAQRRSDVSLQAVDGCNLTTLPGTLDRLTHRGRRMMTGGNGSHTTATRRRKQSLFGHYSIALTSGDFGYGRRYTLEDGIRR